MEVPECDTWCGSSTLRCWSSRHPTARGCRPAEKERTTSPCRRFPQDNTPMRNFETDTPKYVKTKHPYIWTYQWTIPIWPLAWGETLFIKHKRSSVQMEKPSDSKNSSISVNYFLNSAAYSGLFSLLSVILTGQVSATSSLCVGLALGVLSLFLGAVLFL